MNDFWLGFILGILLTLGISINAQRKKREPLNIGDIYQCTNAQTRTTDTPKGVIIVMAEKAKPKKEKKKPKKKAN